MNSSIQDRLQLLPAPYSGFRHNLVASMTAPLLLGLGRYDASILTVAGRLLLGVSTFSCGLRLMFWMLALLVPLLHRIGN